MIMLIPALITHVSDVPHAVAQPYTPSHARTYDYGYSDPRVLTQQTKQQRMPKKEGIRRSRRFDNSGCYIEGFLGSDDTWLICRGAGLHDLSQLYDDFEELASTTISL